LKRGAAQFDEYIILVFDFSVVREMLFFVLHVIYCFTDDIDIGSWTSWYTYGITEF